MVVSRTTLVAMVPIQERALPFVIGHPQTILRLAKDGVVHGFLCLP